MFVRSRRLFLRPCWPEDRGELAALINEGPLTPNSPVRPWPLTAEVSQRFIDIDRPDDRLLPHFFITLPGTNGAELIGGIGLGREGDEVGLGYWLAHAHRGHGYAAEAITAVLRLAETLGHKRVSSPANLPTARLPAAP